MKKGLLIVAAVLMLVSVAQSGELKVTNWPCTFTPQTLCTLPVKMNIGYYVRLTNQGDSINLTQSSESYVKYTGCRKYNVQANFNCDLAASIAWFTQDPKGFVNGSGSTKSVTIDPSQIRNAPSTTEVNICVTLDKLYLGNVAGGSNGVHVADVTVTVVPAAGAIPCTTL
jgi:hypothetical protein